MTDRSLRDLRRFRHLVRPGTKYGRHLRLHPKSSASSQCSRQRIRQRPIGAEHTALSQFETNVGKRQE